MSYAPQPGTIAYRAIAWLEKQPKGTEVTASAWAEGMGNCDGASLFPCIGAAVDAGLVKRRTNEGEKRPIWFSLGDGKAAGKGKVEDEDDVDPLPRRTVAPDVKPMPGALLPGVRGDEPVAPAPSPAPAPPPLKIPQFKVGTPVTFVPDHQPERRSGPEQAGGRPMTLSECAAAEEKPAVPRSFDAWFSGLSGEVVLQGVVVDDDGDVVLSKDQVRVLMAALSGVAA